MDHQENQRYPNRLGGSGNWSHSNRISSETLSQVNEELQRVGHESCELIVGMDFTRSNVWTGRESFGGRCLHDVHGSPNPYIQALSLIARTLGIYDDDHLIPCYGFGDYETGKDSVFSFFKRNQPAHGLDALLERYKQIAPLVDMHGPTSFAPLIYQAMRTVYDANMKFHVLLILADGQISAECLEDTKEAIEAACDFPLSIVVIGVGDGPWDDMKGFDYQMPNREWDNFRFFEFNEVFKGIPATASQQREEDNFKFNVLAELPQHYQLARDLTGLHKKASVARTIFNITTRMPLDPPGFH